MSRSLGFVGLLLVGFALGDAAAAQSIRVGALPAGVAAPTIDGVLDDEAWEHATVLGDLTQVIPLAGPAPSERTEVRLLYDSRNVYLQLRCFDSEPSLVRATLSQRDANLDPDDRVEWLFDTFHDHRNAFWFQIGAGGSKGDALVTKNGSSFNKRWDTPWFGRSRVTPEGWQAEVAIPSASINFDRRAPLWGFNLRRLIRRKTEEARWASPEPGTRFFEVARAGTLEGIEGLEQGLGLDLKPFVVGTGVRGEDDRWDGDFDAGLDVFYRISPATKLSLSFRTDFAEVEVDDRQVNLTRFPLFFPEKRDFFLEDSGAFFFGPGNNVPVEPFFSRRIGLGASGGEVPLDVALKLTRSTDASNLGLLGVRTGAAGTLDAQELFVGRFSRNFGEQSDAGVLWTHGDPRDLGRDDTYGFDLNLRDSHFRGDENLRFSVFALRSDADDARGHDAWYAGVSYPNDEVSWSFDASGVDEGFDPAIGFVRRRGIRRYSGEYAFRPRLYSNIRRAGFRIEPELTLDSGNELQTAEISVRPLDVEWESGEEFELEFTHFREILDQEFEIADDVPIGVGGYTFDRANAQFEMSARREFAVQIDVGVGEFFDGHRDDLELGVAWRPTDRGSLTLGYERNDVRLPAGAFRVHVASLRGELQFGPELSWSNLLQWDNESENLGWNSRMWWIPRPGTEVFFVVNQAWEWDTSSLRPGDSQVALKFGTTLRF